MAEAKYDSYLETVTNTHCLFTLQLPPPWGKDLNCWFNSEYTPVRKRKMFHLLKINISKAEALAVYRVGDGAVHHLHLLGLHGAGGPRVPAEVVSAAVDVEPGERARTAVTPSHTSGSRGHTQLLAPARLASRAPSSPESRVPTEAPHPSPVPIVGTGSSGLEWLLPTFLESVIGKMMTQHIGNVKK